MRETGWYWVKIQKGADWDALCWDGGLWLIPLRVGLDVCKDDGIFLINEQRILNPDEIPTTN